MFKQNLSPHQNTPYRGRFAPTPSGDLHFGSLISAMASYADARFNHGQWIIRIDDIDRARVVNGSVKSILSSIEKLGFQWDEPLYYQSNHSSDYQDILNDLSHNHNHLVYPCYCSRKDILSKSPSGIYPGTCNDKKREIIKNKSNHFSLRIAVNNNNISFEDVIQGNQNFDLKKLSGDFIVFRSDHIFSYQFTFVADIFIDQISHVIRGYDLIDSSPKQIYLQKLLSFDLPIYAHIPIITNKHGIKLSKSCHAKTVIANVKNLILAANILGQTLDKNTKDATIDEFWIELISKWDINKIPKSQSICLNE